MLKYEDLIGLPFELGTQDCFTLVRDFYRDNYGIVMQNYARPSDWSSDKLDIIGKSYEREGFYKVEDWSLATLQPGDLLAMAIGQSKANHLAVYVGGNDIVHHVVYQLSTLDTLRDFWRKTTCYVLRHKDVSYEPEVLPDVTIKELVNERYNLTPETDAGAGRD